MKEYLSFILILFTGMFAIGAYKVSIDLGTVLVNYVIEVYLNKIPSDFVKILLSVLMFSFIPLISGTFAFLAYKILNYVTTK